jgi:hypothetical protein
MASAASAAFLFQGLPTSVDEMVQLLHARALLGGGLTLPLPGDASAWMIQNSLPVSDGWASVYPPFHTIVLAGAGGLGAFWLAGPLATGALAAFSFLAFVELFPGRAALTRTAGLLVALCPFLFFLGGSHLSHTTAAAAVAGALWCLLRARDGGWGWSVAAGAAIGVAVSTRPWTGLALCAVFVVAAWNPAPGEVPVRTVVRRIAGLALGGSTFALLLLGWNQALFGHPFRLGYSVAYGPSHGLGLHTDPWGNAYGLVETMAYTGADLMQLGSHLLETPMPALAVVGLGLLLSVRLPRGTGPLLVWVGAGVGANALYWHHGLHMGPRFLFETGPAWVALWALALAELAGKASPLPPAMRRSVAWLGTLSVLTAVTLLVPGRAGTYRADDATVAASTPPPGGAEATLVFVHGSWTSRVSARLAAVGMRRDSIETALRRNDLCSVDRYAKWRLHPEGEAPVSLSLASLPGPDPALQLTQISEGNRVWLRPGAPLEGGCLREAMSDRHGTVELEPLLWQAPPLPGAHVVVARDMGPLVNARVRSALPGYTARVGVDGGTQSPMQVLGYEEGMERLWGGAAGLNAGGE